MINRRFLISCFATPASLAGMLVVFLRLAQAEEIVTPSAVTAPAAPAEPATVAAPAVAETPATTTAPATTAAPVGEETPQPAATKPKPPPYSLPWQLRPVAPGNVVRLDSSYGFYKNPANNTSGSALVSTLLGSYKVIPDLAIIGRVGLVDNSPPTLVPQIAHKTDILNPVLGGLYGIKLSPNLKLGLFLG